MRHKNIKTSLFISLFSILIIFSFSSCTQSTYNQSDDSNNISDYSKYLENIPDTFSSCLPKEKIYATSYINPVMEIDLSNINTLYDYSDIVLVGTVSAENGGEMLEEIECAGLNGTLSIENVIKGDYKDKTIDFFTFGGYCSIKQYIDTMSKNRREEIEKLGLNKLSVEEQNNNYLVFNSMNGKKFELGIRYVLMLKEMNGKFICMSKSGLIELNNHLQVTSLEDILKL